MQSLETVPPKSYIVTPVVDETTARQAANGYLSCDVGIPFGAIEGIFVPLELPVWQFAIQFNLPRFGRLGIMGTIDVNAETGQPIPLATEVIHKIQDRADAIVQFHTQTAAA